MLALVLLAGCSLPEREPGFGSSDPKARSQAALRAAESNDTSAVPALIAMLDSRDPALRLIAAEALERITGETMGFDQAASESERDAAVERWVEWWQATSGDERGGDMD